MSNRTYVCFDCRTTERVPVQRITRNCRKCRKPAHHVFYKFRIPTRSDDGGWRILESRVRPMNLEWQARALALIRERTARLERQLATAPARHEARRKVLSRRLRALKAKSEEWKTWSAH